MGTYVNNLRLLEITTGDESGTWGTKTNTNLELIADAFGSGTEAITTNADTHTTTIADGAADEGRAIFLKYTGTLDSACTITLAPNTVNKLWFIENATSGSQNIIISQGSGANITIGNGKVAAVYTDGAGSGAAVLDAFADLELSSTLTVAGAVTMSGDASVGDDLSLASDAAVLNFGADSDVSLTHVADTGLLLNSTRQLQFYDASQRIAAVDATTLSIGATDEIDLTATALDFNGTVDVSGTTTLNAKLTVTSASEELADFYSTDTDAYIRLRDSNDSLYISSDNGVASFGGSTGATASNVNITLSNGYLGVGTTSPSAHLDIRGTVYVESASEQLADFYSSDTDAYIRIRDSNDSLYVSSDNAVGSFGGNAGADAGNLNIDLTNGNVAIGTATTTARALTVKHEIALETSDSTNYYQVYAHTDDSFRINYNASGNDEFMIDSSGNVIIQATAKVYLDGGSNTYIHESAADTIQFVVGGTSHFQVQGDGVIIPSAHNLYLDGGGNTYITEGSADVMRFYAGGSKQFEVSNTNMTIVGALSKGSGSFKIDHPLDSMKDTHDLVHSFIEGPRADLMYRGSVQLSGGTATVDLDDAATMTDGTWELLCRDPQVWVQNEDGWTQVRGSVSGSTLTITAQDGDCTDTVSWLVVAERQDKHMMDTNWTDDNGRVIVELEKPAEDEE